MPYTPQTWADDPTHSTPLSATRLQVIEAGIAAATALAEAAIPSAQKTAPNGVATLDGSGKVVQLVGNGAISDAQVSGTAGIAQTKVAGLVAALAALAPLVSPTFTGTPSTAADPTTDLGLATKHYVDTVAANVIIADYTLGLSDQGRVIEVNLGTGVNVTVPPNSAVAFPIGTVIDLCQIGAGAVTVVAGAGVTVRTPTTLVSGGQYASLSLRKRNTDEWVLAGLTT